MHADVDRWNVRYRGRDPGPPTSPIGLTEELTPPGGTCLDVACGLGEQSLWAAHRGFQVVAIDASDVAIESLRAAAGAAGIGDRIDARVVDLDLGLPTDLVGRCALVICQRFRDVGLYPQLADALAPGGVLVITVLSQVGVQGDIGPFHAPVGDLALGFRDLDVEIVRSVEEHGAATLLARRQC